MLLEWSAFIAAVAFVVLVLFMIRTLITARHSLERASSMIEDTQRTLNELNGNVQDIVKNANVITTQAQQQVEKVMPLMQAIENTGVLLEELTSAAKQVSTGFIHGARKATSRNKPVTSSDVPAASQRAAADVPYNTSTITAASHGSHSSDDIDHEARSDQSESSPRQGRSDVSDEVSERWKSWVDIGIQAWQLYRYK